MLIDSLRVVNYKGHEDTEISFDRITSFVGLNGSGKSSCSYHPLKLVLYNTNWSIKHIRKGQDESSITIRSKNSEVVRTRNKKSQSLKIVSNGSEQLFTGKKGLDAKVAEYLGIKKVTLDEGLGPEDINFIPVKASPFIINKSDEGVRRVISGILKLNEAEAALKTLKEEEKSLTKEVAQLNSNRKEVLKLLEDLQNEEKILELKSLITKQNGFIFNLNEFYKVVPNKYLVNLTIKVNSTSSIIGSIHDATILQGDSLELINETLSKIDNILNLISIIEGTKTNPVQSSENNAKNYDFFRTLIDILGVDTITSYDKTIEILEEDLDLLYQLFEIVTKLDNNILELDRLNDTLAFLQSEQSLNFQELSEIEVENCPTCGQLILDT